MENFRDFDRDQKQNWLKGVVALICVQKPLELFIDGEVEVFHRQLIVDLSQDQCIKECDFKNWRPRPNQIPPLECEVCSRWRDAILANHTSRHGKVMWLNCKPHLWSKEKWEVAKVFMPDGHKNHNSIGDFDIAALLCLMNQCKHFKKFELGALCDKVACVRNKIMHAPKYQLEQGQMVDYFNRIRELGEVLARQDHKFTGLSQDIDEIQNLNYRLILPNSIVAQRILAKDEKELEKILFEAAEHQLTKMKLEKLERQIAQLHLDNRADYYALNHKPRGLCVIINNEEFQGNKPHRRGSQQDEQALKKVFTRLGFDVVINRNLTAENIRLAVKTLGSRDFLNEDALVVCVLTHGEKGYVFGIDEQLVALRELTQPFTSEAAPTLAGKPKLFFIQACQGSSYQRGTIPCLSRPRHGKEDRQIRLEEEVAGPNFAGPEVAGPNVAGPNVAGPEVAGPNVAGPNVAGPNVAGPEVAGPNVAGPEVAGPNVAGPEVAGPNVAGPNVAGPEVAGPNVTGPNVAGPNVAGPNVAGPEIAGPEVPGREVAGSEVPGREVAGSYVAGPEVAGPEVAGPDVAGPEIADPEVPGREVAGPDVAGPDVAGPEIAGPEVPGREVAGSNVTGPEVAGPEVAGPDVAGPQAAGRVDTDREDAGHPGSMPCPLRPREEEGDGQIYLEEDAACVPWGADFLLGMATVADFIAFRNIRTGSIYIQELCRQLTKSAESLGNDDILTVLTRVNREVSRGNFCNFKQIPEPKYTLTKKLVLKFV